MKVVALALLGFLAAAGAMAGAARGQTPAPPPPVTDGPRYLVSYVEVMPSAWRKGMAAVLRFRDAARAHAGNLRADVLQRVELPRHFVLLEAWQDEASVQGRAQHAATARLREEISAIQTAPIDERVHFALSVGPLAARASPAAFAAVTHVDVIPTQREAGTALTKELAERGRAEEGNLRFEALVQTNRQNHFTVIELWRDRKALDGHAGAAATRAFRQRLAPLSGALYDERFYRPLP